MGWKVFKEINKIFSFMTLFVFLAYQLHAEVSKDCLTGILNETENTCLAKSDIINEINKDFQTVFAFGNVTSISQPPLVITCLLYTSPSPRDGLLSRMPSSA